MYGKIFTFIVIDASRIFQRRSTGAEVLQSNMSVSFVWTAILTQRPMQSERHDVSVMTHQIPREEEWDDTKDYLFYLAYLAEQANEADTMNQLPLVLEVMDEEEAMRLALKVSQEQPLALPCYAVAVMHVGLSEKEALRVAMEACCVAPPPSPWV
jgi:hypothetical protein